MATIRLVPSTYYLSSSSYLSVSSASNMYNNCDNTTYATVTNSRTSTTSYYIYLRGFNFDDIPTGATVNSFTIKLKARESGVSTSTSYKPYLANGTSAINGSCDVITTTAATHTFSGISADWDTIVSYGTNFGIRINCRRASRNTTGYMYIYGAEIEVDYTMSVYHSVTVTGTDVDPSGTTSVLEGSDLRVKIHKDAKPTVTDNGIDVTSQLQQGQDDPASYTVTNVTTTYGFALNSNDYYESNNKAHSSSAAVCRVDFALPVECTVVFSVINYAEATYDYGLLSNVDTTLNTNASADSSNVYWSGSSHNSASVQTVTYTIAAGSHYVYVKYFKDSYTDSYNDSLQFKVAITPNEPVSTDTYWYYDLANIVADHTIIVTDAGVSDKIWVKTSYVDTLIAPYSSSAYDTNLQAYFQNHPDTTGPFSNGDTIFVSANVENRYMSEQEHIEGQFVLDSSVDTGTTYVLVATGNVYKLDYMYNKQIVQGYDSLNVRVMMRSPGQYDYETSGTISVYKRSSGGWTEAIKVYKKINDSWIQQTDLTTVFDPNTHYVKG